MAKASELLRVEMVRQRMTQSRLSDLTGISVPTVGRHYRGEYPMSAFTTYLYARALGIEQCRLVPEWAPSDSNRQPTGDRFESGAMAVAS